MSTLKLKSQVVKTLGVAVLDGRLPKGVITRCRIKDRRLWVDIISAPFDVMKPENIKIEGGATSWTLSIFSPEKDHTAEGLVLRSQVTNIVRAICPASIIHFDGACYMAQARRMRVANAPPVMIDHEIGPGGRIDLTTPIRCF